MRKLFYAIVLFGLIGLSGCALNKMVKMAEDQNLVVTPNPLEVHADTVTFDMAANLPVKMLKKGKVYTVRTFYNYGDGEEVLKELQFRSEDFPNADETQPSKTETYMFAYRPEMKSGMLEVQGVASDPNNDKMKETERMPLAPGIITTSKLVMPVAYAAYADHGYNNQEELVPTNVNFYFTQGSSVLRSSERTGDRGDKLDAYIAEKNLTRTVTITGTHSPEGPERVNSDLSKNRAEAIETFYRREMSKYDYQGMADSIEFVIKDVVEDWTVFKDSLATYDGISSEEKSEYLNIINGAGSYEEKEDQLHSLPSYNKVFRELYPKMRVAETEILTVLEKKTDSEISVLSKQLSSNSVDADTLSNEELLYGATLTPSLSEKEAIYKASISKEDTWVAHNNLAAVYIAMANENPGQADQYAEQAMTQLELAANMQETAEVHANLASVNLMMGNPYKAYSHLNKAMGMSPSNELAQGANGVKGAAEIMMAKYADAVRSTSNAENTATNLFNKGLAQVLNEDYNNAVSSFEQAAQADSNMAMAHYGAAIASAHLGNESAVLEHLGQAFDADPELKQMAMNDLEFATYASNAQFQEILK